MIEPQFFKFEATFSGSLVHVSAHIFFISARSFFISAPSSYACIAEALKGDLVER